MFFKDVRKVKTYGNTKWYTLGCYEENPKFPNENIFADWKFSVDIVKEGKGRWVRWEIYIRTDHEFQRTIYDRNLGGFIYLKNAKKFVKDYAIWYADPHCSFANEPKTWSGEYDEFPE